MYFLWRQPYRRGGVDTPAVGSGAAGGLGRGTSLTPLSEIPPMWAFSMTGVVGSLALDLDLLASGVSPVESDAFLGGLKGVRAVSDVPCAFCWGDDTAAGK